MSGSGRKRSRAAVPAPAPAPVPAPAANSDSDLDIDESQSNRPSAVISNPPQSSLSNNSFRRGSIYRVSLTNFMAYTQITVWMGPKLNLILGPNGTGKSTLVCALCLGLAGDPKSLGRADKLGTFVRRGTAAEDPAAIEIELYRGADNGRDHLIIRRHITADSHTEWFLGTRTDTQLHTAINNQKRCRLKDITDVIANFNIQVDNLCVLLAQERVGAFSEMRPKEVLIETEKAADPELYKLHQELIELRKSQRETEQKLLEQSAVLEQKSSQLRILDADRANYEHRRDLVFRVNLLRHKRRLWSEYEDRKPIYLSMKSQVAEAELELKTEQLKQQPMHDAIELLRNKVKENQSAIDNNSKQVELVERQRFNLSSILDTLSDSVEERRSELIGLTEQLKQHQNGIKELKRKVRELESKQSTPAEEKSKSDQIAELTKQSLAVRKDLNQAQIAVSTAQEAKSIADAAIIQCEIEQKAVVDKPKQRLDRAFRIARDKYFAPYHLENYKKYLQLKSENKFQSEVFGPLLSVVNVANDYIANCLETGLGKFTFAYITQNRHDWNLLTNNLHKAMVINPNTINNNNNNAIHYHSAAHLKQYGIIGVLDDFIECNPIIRTALRDIAFTGVTAVADRELTTAELDAVLKKNQTDNNRFGSVLTPKLSLRAGFSKYGERSQRINEMPLKQAAFLMKSDPQSENNLAEKIELLRNEAIEADKEYQSARQRQQLISAQSKSIQEEQSKLTSELSVIRGLQSQLKRAIDQWNQKKQSFNIDSDKNRLNNAIIALDKQRLTKLRELKPIQLKCLELSIIRDSLALALGQSKLQLNHLESQQSSGSDLLRRFKSKLDNSKHQLELMRVEQVRLKERATKACKREEFIQYQSWLPTEMSTIQVDSLITEYTVEISALVNDEAVMSNHDRLSGEVNTLIQSKAELESINIEQKESIIIKNTDWSPRIATLITTIHEQFADYFAAMGCEGSVALDTGPKNNNNQSAASAAAGSGSAPAPAIGDFEQYSISINVSFRSDVRARLLDSQSQSGGEKSVTTMFYLLCLQSVSECPFRVVDEINQGMDPYNERRVMNQIIQSSSNPNTPQYFVVTPKLLPNLKLNSNVNTLFIWNGPKSIDQLESNIKEFIKRGKRQRLPLYK